MSRAAARRLALVAGGLLAAWVLATSWSAAPNLAVHLPCPRNWAHPGSWAFRSSPVGSVTFSTGGPPIKLCYGRPSLRGRGMLGGSPVPYGKLWRTGANEPTIFISPIDLDVAGVRVPAGRASLYSIPGPETWELILNRNTRQWGLEEDYTPSIQAGELGRAIVPSDSNPAVVERFTFSPDQNGIILSWGTTRVHIPVSAASR